MLKKRYLETYYTLAILDYLSRQNDLPIPSRNLYVLTLLKGG